MVNCPQGCIYNYNLFLNKFIILHIVSNLISNRVINGEGNGTPLQYFCLENPMDGRAWWAAVHGVARVGHEWATSLSLFTFHALEKEMATHSSVLAWRIPGTGSLVGFRLWIAQSWTWLKQLSSRVIKEYLFKKIQNKKWFGKCGGIMQRHVETKWRAYTGAQRRMNLW